MTTITQAPPQTAIPEPSRSRVAGRRRIPRLLKLLLLLAFVVLFLIPVYVLLVTSFKPRRRRTRAGRGACRRRGPPRP